MVLDFNKQFIEPLDDNEVIKATKSAEKCYLSKDKRYKYKNSTLIEILDITEEEQQKMKSIIGTKEKNERKKAANKVKRRNENGLTKREQEKQDRINDILKLKELGLNQSEIARGLNISRQAVSRLFKSI
ncbi:MAG: helix-turn-helix domain-containing protein [Clostridiaceae bacterium]|nr:helix-turn-helix domain-containing protein [Clostridiaceae bacterium]